MLTKVVTKENIRGKFIAGLLGLQYSLDDQIALLANGEDSEQHSEEWAAFARARRETKKSIVALHEESILKFTYADGILTITASDGKKTVLTLS